MRPKASSNSNALPGYRTLSSESVEGAKIDSRLLRVAGFGRPATVRGGDGVKQEGSGCFLGKGGGHEVGRAAGPFDVLVRLVNLSVKLVGKPAS
jgi:hypothetical protein